MSEYTNDELFSMYELGRMYFEMGYFAPAERIFNGLSAVDEDRTPSRLGLGLVKLERGLYQEAAVHFRAALQSGVYPLQSKLGMCTAFIAVGELSRAKSILAEIAKGSEVDAQTESELRKLYEALAIRCSE